MTPRVSPIVKKFVIEVMEATAMILVIGLMTDKDLTFRRMARIALIVGAINTVLEYYDKDLHSNIKQGMTFTTRSAFMTL